MPPGVHECGPGRIYSVHGVDLATCFERSAVVVRELDKTAPDRSRVLVGLSADIDPGDGWSFVLTFEESRYPAPSRAEAPVVSQDPGAHAR